MKCHYAVLGLNLDCTTDEIKKAYRKLALRCHPDKNPDNREESTRQFLLIQQAYEVLVDPQERAWYDNHRDHILKADSTDKSGKNGLNLFFYFRASCYRGYGDDPQGFYEVYSKLFVTIYEEETDLDSQPGFTIEFGNSQSSYEELVKPFYAFWEGYCTTKLCVWVEKYDTRQASCRAERRLMEQENKRLRSKAKKERNEEIRELVAFVKKRDPRVQTYNNLMKEKMAERNKAVQQRRDDEKKKRLEGMQQYKESNWSAFSTLASQLEQLEKQIAVEFEDEEEDEDEVDDLAEHLESDLMLDEVSRINDGEEKVELAEETEISDMNELEMLYCVACDKAFKSLNTMVNHRKSRKHLANTANLVKDMRLDDANMKIKDEVDDLPVKTGSKKQKQKKNKKVWSDSEEEQPEKLEPVEVKNYQLPETEISMPADPEDYESVEIEDSKPENPEPTEALDAGPRRDEKLSEKRTKISGKKKNAAVDFVCNVCHSSFPTRNKLFEHINTMGHAVRLDAKEAPKPNNKKGKKSKP